MIPKPGKYFDYQYLSLSKFDKNRGKFVVTSWLDPTTTDFQLHKLMMQNLNALQSKTERKISERKRIQQHLNPNPG